MFGHPLADAADRQRHDRIRRHLFLAGHGHTLQAVFHLAYWAEP